MNDRQFALRVFCTGLVLIAGSTPLLTSCVSPELIVSKGSICTAQSLAECERLSKIGETLHTESMNKAIAEARK